VLIQSFVGEGSAATESLIYSSYGIFFRVGRVERVYNALVKAYKFVQDISMKHALSYSLVLVDEKQYNLVPPVWLRD